MPSNVIIQMNRQIIAGKLLYRTPTHYFIKPFDGGGPRKIKKQSVKVLVTLDKLYSIIADLDSKTYIKLAKAVKERGASMGSTRIVFELMNEMGLLEVM